MDPNYPTYFCLFVFAFASFEAAYVPDNTSRVCRQIEEHGIKYCTELGVLVSVEDENSGLVLSSTCHHLKGTSYPPEYINCKRHTNSLYGVHLADADIFEIAPNAFENSNITKLILTTAPTRLKLSKDSFKGLTMLESLTIHSGIVSPSEDPFKELKSLIFLVLTIDRSTENFRGAFQQSKNLSTLIISNSKLGKIGPDTFFDIQPAITDFELNESNGISSIAPQTFTPFINLKSLKMNVQKLSAIQPGSFDGLKYLEKLIIKSDGSSVVPKNIFKELVPLKTLILDSSFIKDIEDDAFSGLNVTNLILSNNNLTELRPGYFKQVAQLKSLDVSNNKITNITGGIFNVIKGLREINLRNNSINSIQPASFSGIVMDSLDLGNNTLSSIKADGSFEFQTYYLSLRNNPITEIEKNALLKCKISTRLFISESSRKIFFQKKKWSGLKRATRIAVIIEN